jgi:fructosamine-3-kinase
MVKGFVPDILRENGITDAITRIDTCGGGCISSCFVVFTRSRTLFVKTNSSDFEPVFRGELASLEAIADTHTVLCPTRLFVGTVNRYSYIAMSYLPDLVCASSGLGSAVARLHLAGKSDRFGFPTVTFCGPTSLDNEMTNEPWSVWFSRDRI